MATVTSKVCVVGDFAVGKTSVIERFVSNHFSEKYLSTVGVKLDTKDIVHKDIGISQKLIIWDVAGSNRFSHTEFAYLRGAGGLVFVADGTRSHTAHAVCDLRKQVSEMYGPTPCVLLVNKTDLEDQWELSDERIADFGEDFSHVYKTSAKTGDEVESALTFLAKLIIENDLRER